MSVLLFRVLPMLFLVLGGGLLALWISVAMREDRRLEDLLVKFGHGLTLLLVLWAAGVTVYQNQVPMVSPGQLAAFLAAMVWVTHTSMQ
ncbi:hypothetical protein GF324_04385, partial [bacterium]|nr:hypothetical protein [bacterium]